MPKLKLIAVLACILFFGNLGYSQFNISNNIPAEQRKILCDYEDFLNKASSQEERQIREELLLTLFGVLDELSEYRQQFLSDGKLINLFPTAYYHTTMSEMLNIVDKAKGYDHPIEKMKQMIAFYDAYKYNRKTWDLGVNHLIEEHWRVHFEKSSINVPFNNYADLQQALESGINAHVNYDLARAINFAFNNRYNISLTEGLLRPDFNRTDEIFSKTASLTNKDVASISWIYVEWVLNLGNFFLNKDKEVKDLRSKAWDRAFKSANFLGIDGKPLIKQPTTNHSELFSKGSILCPQKLITSTLFLFDLSGSMNANGASTTKSKLVEAKDASKITLNELRNNNAGVTPEVAVLGFSGSCMSDPTRVISDFESNLALVESRIDAMAAGGGTPLAEAIAAAKCKYADYLAQTKQTNGKLIILSDGQATCGKIRPAGVYNSAPLDPQSVMVNAQQCAGGASLGKSASMKYYTIGFNIPPGSPAERDLQYLAQISGGKYLNVQSQVQLERAFRKFNRTYVPKPNPVLSNLPASSVSQFSQGVSQINSESFRPALESCEAFVNLHSDDCHGVYNLALMQEANDLYKPAIANYQKYLTLCPNASDRSIVERQIKFLEEEFKEFLLFQKEVVKSDLEYLNLHFKKIQNGESVALADEFKGFLKEKGDYYKRLPEMLDRNERSFKRNTQEVADGLDSCAKTINRNPKTWDRDAAGQLGMTYLSLESLLELF